MGGSASVFDETNWQAKSGALTDATQTLDGAEPVAKYSSFHLTRRAKASRRDYDVCNYHNITLYQTHKVQGTDVWFDVLEGGTGRPLLRVKAKSHRRKDWDVYTFDRPAYDGQHPDEEASKRAFGKGRGALHRKARLTLTFESPYMGNVFLYEKGSDAPAGVPSSFPILSVQLVKDDDGAGTKFQTVLSTDSNGDKVASEGVGFWAWEEDAASGEKRITMHLVKGTDLALHTVLAIITDLVWHERQGLAASAGAGGY